MNDKWVEISAFLVAVSALAVVVYELSKIVV